MYNLGTCTPYAKLDSVNYVAFILFMLLFAGVLSFLLIWVCFGEDRFKHTVIIRRKRRLPRLPARPAPAPGQPRRRSPVRSDATVQS